MHFISCPHHIYLHTTTSCFGGSKSCGNRVNNRGKFKNNKYDVVAAGSEGRDSEFEIDQDKAREALKKLDQQLQSISDKPVSPPKIRGPSYFSLNFIPLSLLRMIDEAMIVAGRSLWCKVTLKN